MSVHESIHSKLLILWWKTWNSRFFLLKSQFVNTHTGWPISSSSFLPQQLPTNLFHSFIYCVGVCHVANIHQSMLPLLPNTGSFHSITLFVHFPSVCLATCQLQFHFGYTFFSFPQKKRKLSNDNKTIKSLFVLFICIVSQVLNTKDKPPVTTQFNLSGVADISRMLVVHLNSNNLLGVQLIKQLGGRHCPLDIIITCNRIAAGHGRYTHIAPLCMYIYRRS